jgi:ribosome-associated heat shock protein Hsp15
MSNDSQNRADKWLWAVRIYKTRSQAAEACKKGRIIIGDVQVKPSRSLKKSDVVIVRKPPVIYTYQVIDFPPNRVGAKYVPDYMKDLTSVEELEKLQIKETAFLKRDKGKGRPTKKERRELDKIRNKK